MNSEHASGQQGCRLNSAAGICLVTGVTQMNAIIHCKANIFMTDAVNHPYITVVDNINTTGEVDLIVEDIPYEIVDGTYQDPDEQLCEFYEIDYNLVNCIEAA
jgi:hypothetical protein